ncbi:MAG: MFS transporter [Paracoccaceae bacterium]|nr:MFS transporter [Paracoccaceae bacterium]
MRIIISFVALFLSVILLQLSSSAIGPLDALSGLKLNFSNFQIGLLGSSHFFGFFIGCWWAPRLMGSVGHSRAFAAFTALGAIGIIAHTLTSNPYAWAVMRIGSGLCVAGCYTVIEAWLNGKVTNQTRGRAMGTYRMADMGASMLAQLLIGLLEPAYYISYNLLAIVCCLAILPLTITKISQPETPTTPRLRPKLALLRSPLATFGVVIAGLTASSFRMVGPIYGESIGLRTDQIGYFLALSVLGGAIAQYPIGWLADKYDRRKVLISLSLATIVASTITIVFAKYGTIYILTSSFLFGFFTWPIFSISAAHANDFSKSEERVELAAALIFFYAVGAIASPLFTAQLLEYFGPSSLFIFFSIGHLVLIIFGISRSRIRPTNQVRTPNVSIPRTSFAIGRLLRRSRK